MRPSNVGLAAALLLGLGTAGCAGAEKGPMGAATVKASEFVGSSADWLNSKPLSIEQLRGKVVLVDFWEYT